MIKKVIFVLACMTGVLNGFAQKPSDTPVSQMEKLDRGLVAIKTATTGSYFLSWRLLGTDNKNTVFSILRDGVAYANGRKYTNRTNFTVTGNASTKFQVVTWQDGVAVDTTEAVTPWDKMYMTLKLDRPIGGTIQDWRIYHPKDGDKQAYYEDSAPMSYTYSPNDCSVGDVDGDGQYEIFVKWDPSTSLDNSIGSGNTGSVYIDCYKLDGTKLWRIDLGNNIRAGAHYTQFLVYDFNKDGKAELICKTAPGSKDGVGNYVNQASTDDRIKAASNTKDWRVSGGRINGGQEYLTVFDGQTGAAIHTIAYYPNRNAEAELSDAAGTYNWDDRSGRSDEGTYGNRGERYLAAVAYLGGQDANPSGVFTRGYYTYAYVWAVDFDGTQLKHRWLHRSDSKTQYSVVDANMNESAKITAPVSSAKEGRNTMYGNGNHNISVGDVDGDGKDEIIWGSAAVDDDGKLLYSVGYGHGDAIHLADLNPDRPGLELFDIHEDKGTYAWDVHDAATGEILLKGGQSGQDNGRGCAADIVADSRGYEFWSAYGGFDSSSRNQNPFNTISGEQVGSKGPRQNFRIYWDDDEYDELLDDVHIYKYNGNPEELGVGRAILSSMNSPASCNGSKATPCLVADIFGDWREEVILRSTTDDATLNIYSTITAATYRVPTLMHDHVYRMGVAWQNVGYNQPPHLGYYLPDFIKSFEGVTTAIQSIEVDEMADDAWYTLQGVRIDKPSVKGVYIHKGRKVIVD